MEVTIDDLSLFVISIIRTGAALRFLYCMVRLFGFLAAGAVWLIFRNVAATVVTILTGIFGSVMMCTKDQNNLSVADQIVNIIRFSRSQQIYPYRAMREWG